MFVLINNNLINYSLILIKYFEDNDLFPDTGLMKFQKRKEKAPTDGNISFGSLQSNQYYVEPISLCFYAPMPPLSTPLAPDNCRQNYIWRFRGFPLGSPPKGR